MRHRNNFSDISAVDTGVFQVTCPTCGCELHERQTAKGVTFLVCSQWPKCRVSGTPELLERFSELSAPEQPEIPIRIGNYIRQVAQLRIHQAKLKQAKTKAEREQIRKQALETLK